MYVHVYIQIEVNYSNWYYLSVSNPFIYQEVSTSILKRFIVFNQQKKKKKKRFIVLIPSGLLLEVQIINYTKGGPGLDTICFKN